MASHTFLTLLVLLCLALLLGEALFYKYSILAERKETQITGETIKFRENLYQEVLTEWQARAQRFEQAGIEAYPDPFRID